MSYKTELHCHSKDASGCAHESVEGIVEKYLKYGYSTICLTNHFQPTGNFLDKDEWMAKIERKYAAYDKLVKAADGQLTILFGLEFRFIQSSNDYLVFGFTREWLENQSPEILKNGIGSFTALARPEGILTIQAHPFRSGMVVTNPNDVDGIEVFNGHPGHNSRNEIADFWAEKNGKMKTSGTDHHDPAHMPRGGIETDVKITSESQLVEVLKSGNYRLLMD